MDCSLGFGVGAGPKFTGFGSSQKGPAPTGSGSATLQNTDRKIGFLHLLKDVPFILNPFCCNIDA